MNFRRMIGALRRARVAVLLLMVLVAGFLGSALVSPTHAGTPPFPDMRGDYTQGACVGGTLADCEANPQYPSQFTISAEDFTTGVVTLAAGGTGTISGCSLTIGAPITASTPRDPYSSQENFTISPDGMQLTGTFDDSYGRRGQPIFANRTSGGPATCPATDTTTSTTTTSTTTTTTPTDTTTSTTTTTPTLKATATQVSCDYYVATSNDTCHVSVGDATGSASSPTGTVSFSGDRTGACTLTPTPSSPGSTQSAGVSSCAITVPGTESTFLNITATYPGDSTHAGSSGSTQWLNAAPGTTLYNPTIEKFDPPTLQFAETNPVAGSTVTGQATLTDGATDEAQSCPAPAPPEESTLARSAKKHAKVHVAQLSVKSVVRHAPKGKVKLKLNFSTRRLRKAFPGTHAVTLRIALTVAPPHGAPQTVFATETLKLHVPKRGRVRVTGMHPVRVVQVKAGAKAAAQLIAHAAGVGATFHYGATAADGICSLSLTLNIPDLSSPTYLSRVTGTLSGVIPAPNCNRNATISFPFDGAAGLGQSFTGSVANNNGRVTYVADSSMAHVYGSAAGPCGPFSFDYTLPAG